MNRQKEKTKNTTVSVTTEARDKINQLAEDQNLSQREMVTRIIESYQRENGGDRVPSGMDPPNMMQMISENLDKVIKRDDRVIAFIKEQEKVLLNPILQTVQSMDARIKQLVTILSNLE